MRDVIGQLEQLRSRGRALLIAQRLSVILAAFIGALIVGIVLDFFLLRLPSWFRLATLLIAVGLVGWFVWTYLRPALRFHPSLTQLALRVERSLPALQGRLTSSVEFAIGGVDKVNPLAARSVRDTTSRVAGENLTRVLAPKRTMRDLSVLAVTVVIAGMLAITFPTEASTGLQRLLLPLGGAEWPARTGVRSLVDDVVGEAGVHPRGQVLPLRAEVTKGAVDQRVDAVYRMTIDGATGSWERILLTHQDGAIHERLVDTNAESIEVYFETSDHRTATTKVRLEPPPAIIRATLNATAPAYAAGRVPDIVLDMGPGLDDRAVTEDPILVGSRVHLELELNKPIDIPSGAEAAPWIMRTIGWTDEPLPTMSTIETEAGRQWVIEWDLDRSRTLRMELVDEYGLTNREVISYRVDAIEDHHPEVTITEPQADEAVLATATVNLVAEARDDVALQRVGLEAARRSAEQVASDDETDPFAATSWTRSDTPDAAVSQLSEALDLTEMDLAEGDEVLVRATALDVYELDGLQHDQVHSPVRRLRVISELDFATQLRRQLSAVRQNAIRIEAMQAELQDDVIDTGVQPGVTRAQAQFAERIADQRAALDEVAQRLDRNRLDDRQLSDLLGQSNDLLDYAGRAANRAVEAMEERAGDAGSDSASDSPETDDDAAAPDDADPEIRQPDEDDRPVVDAQQDVRDELTALIELLDRDEDTWVVTRQLETLLNEQAAIELDTAQLAQRTVGQSPEDMSPEDRSELDRIAERQSELENQATPLLDSLRDRAEAMEDVDPQSAAGMRTAAETGESRELDRDMERAAERIQDGQLQSARSAQSSARQTIQQMLDDLEENKQARAEQLLRQLASLQESINRLIVVQENELTALERSVDADDFSGRDRSMIRLNQNTVAVAGEARAAGQQARRIARALDRAADAQGAAVAALRATPLAVDAAREAEERSLTLLQEAAQLAEELEEDVQDEETRRRREELMKAYRDVAERQIAVRGETLGLQAVPDLNRRQLVEARRHGNTQDEIRTTLSDLRAATQELAEATVFSYVHTTLDEWCTVIAEALWDGSVDVDVTDRQSMVLDGIGRLIQALEESNQEQQEFDQESETGGQQGGQQQQAPLIPPLAELKLMRGMQELIYDQTLNLNERADLEAGSRRTRLRELGIQQRNLIELGQQMLEQMQQSQQPAPVPPGPEQPGGDGP